MVGLFGGAIVASIPPDWRDVSNVRQVPGESVRGASSSFVVRSSSVSLVGNNQEVYQDCADGSGSVLIIEILEYQRDVDDVDACSYFMDDLTMMMMMMGDDMDHSSDDDDDGVDDDDDDGWMTDRSTADDDDVKKSRREHCPRRRRRRRRRRRGRGTTTVRDGRVIDLLPRNDEGKVGSTTKEATRASGEGGGVTGDGRWFRDFTLPPMAVDERLVACIARCTREEDDEDVDEEDPDDGRGGVGGGGGRRVVDVDMCVLRLGIVGADVLITLSRPRRGIVGHGGGNAAVVGPVSSTDDVDGTFREVLNTFNVKDWGLFGC
ncbi:hypothetical protein ACHAXA_005259 [Cyclostephanos tholiformis]|uniref:Uncharacterized protein n=1 Tax=Cyclostephanos tholiformis TaxID=382380 RepID=A0ABD3R546_9STRA